MCREYTHSRSDEITMSFAVIPGVTVIGSVTDAHVIKKWLTSMQLKLKVHLQPDQVELHEVLMCRGSSNFVSELHSQDHNHKNLSSELLKEKAEAEGIELIPTDTRSADTEETRAKCFKNPPEQTCCREEIIRWTKESGKETICQLLFRRWSWEW